jgi:hypothetical protein
MAKKKAASNPSKGWSMPARVGVGAAVGYLLLGPVGGVGGAIAGSMYTLERNPGPGFLATGKQFGINFPNGYGIIAGWGGKTAFSRYTSLSTTLPNGELEKETSDGWGPSNFALHVNKTAKRRKPIRAMVGLAEKPKARSIKSLGVGIFSKGPNFSIVFETGWAIRVDPESPEPRPTSSQHYNFAPTATVFLYTPGGELVETMEGLTPVKLAAVMEQVARFKAQKPMRKRRGNKPSPIKGEFVANPYRKGDYAEKIRSEMRKLHEASAGIRRVIDDKKAQLSGRKAQKTSGKDEAFDIRSSYMKMKRPFDRLTNNRMDKSMIETLNKTAPAVYPGDMRAVRALLDDFSQTLERTDYDTIVLMMRDVPGLKLADSDIPKHHTERKRRGIFGRRRRKTNPSRKTKSPTASDLKKECRRLWEHYCERPNKTRLRAVMKHCELMAESSAKSVKEERARCMRSVRREMKKLGMK